MLFYFHFQRRLESMLRLFHQQLVKFTKFSKRFPMRQINTGYESVDKLADKATFGKIDSIIQWYEDKFGLSEVRHAQEDAIKVLAKFIN